MEKRCPRCGETLPLDAFYKRRSGRNTTPYCKPCTNNQTLERQRALKAKAVQYKGGKCEFCGYARYAGALEFHHRDPSQKDFTLAGAHLTAFERVKDELDKCYLLCANCHREEHARMKGAWI